MVSSDFSSLFVLVLLIIVLVFVNERYNDVVVKTINDIIHEIEKFLNGHNKKETTCFPKSCLPIYSCDDSLLDPPCLEPYKSDCNTSTSCPQNVITVNCGTGNSVTDNVCNINKCVDNKNICEDVCNNNNRIKFGCYCYVIGYLPGIIYKYSLDSQGNINEESRMEIIHTLGILKRIYIEKDIIYVEDSNSVIHAGTFNPLDGTLTF